MNQVCCRKMGINCFSSVHVRLCKLITLEDSYLPWSRWNILSLIFVLIWEIQNQDSLILWYFHLFVNKCAFWNLQDGKALPDGPVVISPDGLFPSLFREGNCCIYGTHALVDFSLLFGWIRQNWLCICQLISCISLYPFRCVGHSCISFDPTKSCRDRLHWCKTLGP